MRSHQRDIVAAIYDAVEGTLGDNFASWRAEVIRTRGQLDRKKKVGAAQILSALGRADGHADLERFVFAVERYLAMRALAVLEQCVRPSDDSDTFVVEAMQARATVMEAIGGQIADALAREGEEVRTLVESQALHPFTDVFQAEFMGLIPRQVRHAIGAYFTPQWLARHVLREAGYRFEEPRSLARSLMDPSCGSGVFLVAAAEEVRQAVVAGALDRSRGVEIVASNLRGVDNQVVQCLMTLASLALAAHSLAGGRVAASKSIKLGDSLDTRTEDDRVDLIVGNPPWVNWEYMPEPYRCKHQSLWTDLGIFDPRGKAMSFSKEDISALFVAHAVHYRLARSGTFAFVLPESLIKSTSNHRDFRKFALGFEREPYRVTHAEDFVAARPFDGVANRAVVLYGIAEGEMTFPINYSVWPTLKAASQPLTGSTKLSGVPIVGRAQRADDSDQGSSWSTGSADEMLVHRKLDGASSYRARTGLFTGGANAVFHVKFESEAEAGVAFVSNVTERAKRAAPSVRAPVETEFLYPFLRGRDVGQWCSQVELGVLLPHTMETRMAPVTPEHMATHAPLTLEYFEGFREILDARRGFSAWEQSFRQAGFYACQRVGDYTFSDWKVVWRYIAPRFTSAVVGPLEFGGMEAKPVIPNEKLMLISCQSEAEAYFVGGVLASSLVASHVHSRMVSTQISPSIIAGIALPVYSPSDGRHRSIVSLCRRGHMEMASDDRDALAATIEELDATAAELFDVDREIAAAARSSNPF